MDLTGFILAIGCIVTAIGSAVTFTQDNSTWLGWLLAIMAIIDALGTWAHTRQNKKH